MTFRARVSGQGTEGELRLVTDELQKIIDLGEAKGISSQERAELVYGIGQIVAVMRDIANKLEQTVKRF